MDGFLVKAGCPGYCIPSSRRLPLQQKWNRLVTAGLAPGPIEETDSHFVTKLEDPDGNLVVKTSVSRI